MPKLSVITPMYKAEAYIEKAVRSVLAQTFTDFEYIIVNDGSPDGSLAIVERLAQEDARIKLIQMPVNSGAAAATNMGLAQAKGDLIALMDADDICHPDRFAKEIEFLESNPAYGLVGTQYHRMRPDDSLMRKTLSVGDDPVIRFRLFFSVPMCNPTILFRQDILNEMGQPIFNPDLVGAQDYDFFLRIPEKWKMAVLPDYLFQYRIHPEALGTTKKDKVMEETLGLCKRYIATKLPELADNEDVLAFIRVQRDTREPLTIAKLAAFQRGLKALVLAYIKSIPAREGDEVKAFACELEIKTLLGRYKLWRRPLLCAAWILSACKGALCWLPQFTQSLVKEKFS